MQPVLFMIFFLDFVTPQKRNMSERCWLFTLNMAVQSGDFSQMSILVKSTNHQYLRLGAKNEEKNKGTLFSATSKVREIKVILVFLF